MDRFQTSLKKRPKMAIFRQPIYHHHRFRRRRRRRKGGRGQKARGAGGRRREGQTGGRRQLVLLLSAAAAAERGGALERATSAAEGTSERASGTLGIMFCPSDRATTHTTSSIFTFVCVEGKIDQLEGTEEILLVANL